MTDLTQAAAAAAKALNPADGKVSTRERKRIPMSLPRQQLQVPTIPGYVTYWMRGTPDRLVQAQSAGYEFVTSTEVNLNNFDLGGDASKSGNTDMGTRVSVLASRSGTGEVSADGQPLRLYLMKLKEEWAREDQQALDERSAATVRALTGGAIGADKDAATDRSKRYVDHKRTSLPDFFKPKRSI